MVVISRNKICSGGYSLVGRVLDCDFSCRGFEFY